MFCLFVSLVIGLGLVCVIVVAWCFCLVVCNSSDSMLCFLVLFYIVLYL